MSRSNWNRIKHNKFFYVNIYRKLLSILVGSQIITLTLFCGIVFIYASRQAPNFYASSGITLPILLSPLNSANPSAEALLPPDPINREAEKVIPQ